MKVFKIANYSLEIELHKEIINETVKLCGSDPNKAKYL